MDGQGEPWQVVQAPVPTGLVSYTESNIKASKATAASCIRSSATDILRSQQGPLGVLQGLCLSPIRPSAPHALIQSADDSRMKPARRGLGAAVRGSASVTIWLYQGTEITRSSSTRDAGCSGLADYRMTARSFPLSFHPLPRTVSPFAPFPAMAEV